MPDATCELTIRRLRDGSLTADLRLTSAASAGASMLAASVPLAIDVPALLAVASLPEHYGALLSNQLFADQRLREAWLQARAYTVTGALQLRLSLDPQAVALHDLFWETLRDPQDNQPLALHERLRLVRTIDSRDLTPVIVPPRPVLRALLVVASPTNSEEFGLARIAVADEVARARAALGVIPCTILGDHGAAVGRATLPNLTAQLRDGPPIVLLIAHGTLVAGRPYLWLEQEDGRAAQTSGMAIVDAIARLGARPLLLALLSCQSAGSGYDATLSALGPQLAAIGVPAVLAFQGLVSLDTVQHLLPTLLHELARDGQVDRALAAARAALSDRRPWWQALLWLRTDGRLWTDDAYTAGRQRLEQARSQQSLQRYAELQRDVVGRQRELAAIGELIEQLRPTGGYLLVTGVAGQGKSSILAALIAARQPEPTPAYFIRFNPGLDEQLALLGHLIADLLTSAGLEREVEQYLPSGATAITLTNSLMMLFAQCNGAPLTLVIDGLDQIKPQRELGERDLSFLPERLPPGVVIVIGTRPDDTLKPLTLLTPHREYRLPPLSREDFATLLERRGVTLNAAEREALYAALGGNAFELAFVAQEVKQSPASDVPTLLQRVIANPRDLFAPALERLKADRLWSPALRPLLGALTAAVDGAPLSEAALQAILGLATDEASEGLLRLGGFLGVRDQDGQTRYYLLHLKLIDYLRGANAQSRTRIFESRDIAAYHRRIADWCLADLTAIGQEAHEPLEQERRQYARQFLITHLAAARAYVHLWQVIDTDDYGQMQRRRDLSARQYVADLDTARQAVIDAAAGDTNELARALPRLWRYSLLRCSLSSQVTHYPEELFLALVALGQGHEAAQLAELLPSPLKQAKTLGVIGATMIAQGEPGGALVLQRARQSAMAIPDLRARSDALRALATTLAQAQQWDVARQVAEASGDQQALDDVLSAYATALVQRQQWDAARQAIDSISGVDRQSAALHSLARALAGDHQWAAARETAEAIPDGPNRTSTRLALAVALVRAGAAAEGRAIFRTVRREARALSVDEGRAYTLSSLASALVQIGATSEAQATFRAARRAASANADEEQRASTLSALVAALAEARQWDDAHQTANAIDDFEAYNIALSNLAAARAWAQQWELARWTVDTIPDATVRMNALHALTASLAEAQQWDLARQTADAILYDGERSAALTTIAGGLAQAQQWQAAHEVAEAIPSGGWRAAALGTLASALAQTGAAGEAQATFRAARAAVDTIPDTAARSSALSTLATALVEAQQWDDARRAADDIADNETRITVLCALATALARAGRLDTARAVLVAARGFARALLIDEPRAAALSTLVTALAEAQQWQAARQGIDALPASHWARATTLSTLARSLFQAGLSSEAVEVFQAARQAADAILENDLRAEGLQILASALSEAGATSEANAALHAARQAIEAMPEWQRTTALRALSAAFVQTGAWDAARQVAEAIPHAEIRVDALSTLACALARTGMVAEARPVFTVAQMLAENITDPFRRASALAALSAALARTGQWDTAHQLADAISEPRSHVAALCALATALARAGALPRSLAILRAARTQAEAIPEPEPRATAFQALAEAYAAAGQPEEVAPATLSAAGAIGEAFPAPWRRAQALLALVERLAQAGQFTLARSVADSIPGGWRRVEALRLLGATLAQSDMPGVTARATLMDACAAAADVPLYELRAQGLRALIVTLARAGLLQQSTELLADAWRQAATRDELFASFVIDTTLLRAYPTIGPALVTGFAWVDERLRA